MFHLILVNKTNFTTRAVLNSYSLIVIISDPKIKNTLCGGHILKQS